MARVALLTLSGVRDVSAPDAPEFRTLPEDAAADALISAGHEVFRGGRPYYADRDRHDLRISGQTRTKPPQARPWCRAWSTRANTVC